MTYPIRAFVKDTRSWHDISRFEISENGVSLVSNQKNRAFPLFDGEIQHIVISPEVLNEIIEGMVKNMKPKASRTTKQLSSQEAELPGIE